MRQHMGGATPDAIRRKPFGDPQKQDMSRGSAGEPGKASGAEEGYPAPPVPRYNNGLPVGAANPMSGAAPKFSTPNLSGDTIIIGESSLV